MYKYDKKLPFPVNIKKKDLRMAKYIITAFGGYAGELGAALRYFSQKFSMPTEEGKNLLNSIATEELGHNEMVCSMIHQLVKGASLEEMQEAGLESLYAEHGKGIYPTDANGVPFTVTYFASTGDPLADLVEDMAAEQKARVMYEHLIDLAEDEDVIEPLLFLRQREVVHFTRFQELYEKYKKMVF
ncbi:MAG: manganese catalase family protein [Bacilli bacterium]|nr:manganese catalase family protein [Bacilli bacterium]